MTNKSGNIEATRKGIGNLFARKRWKKGRQEHRSKTWKHLRPVSKKEISGQQRSWRKDKNFYVTWDDHQATLHSSQLMEKVSVWVIYKKEARQIQRTTGRSVGFHNFTNSAPQCFATGSTPNSIGTSVPTRQGARKNPNNDHFMTYRLITQKSREWRTDMWVAAIDFKEAFDWTQHEAIWRSLRNHSDSEQYICFLKKFFTDHRATALTVVESDEFSIARGQNKATLWAVSSSTRFSNQEWRKTLKHGKKRVWASNWVMKKDCISNLRFADDVLLMATSVKQLKKWSRTSKNTEVQELEIHPNKTRILTNQKTNRTKRNRNRRDARWDTSSSSKITVVDQEPTEVQHRIRCAWSAFSKHRQEVTSQSHRLQHQLRLLDAVVTPTTTNDAGTWTTTKEPRKMLRTQRRMLRLIIQTERNTN